MSQHAEVEYAKSVLHRVGAWAGLKFLARQGVSIECAMQAHCGYVPANLR